MKSRSHLKLIVNNAIISPLEREIQKRIRRRTNPKYQTRLGLAAGFPEKGRALFMSGRFNRAKLPDPAAYYKERLANLSKPNSKGWILTNCVFHSPDKNPSLSVNLNTGAFKCFACAASGGDVLDFHRLLTGEDFQTVCQSLGCWEFTR